MVKKYLILFKLLIFLLVPLTLILLPTDHFDEGQSISLFEWVGAENYYSKGITRACMHFIHLDFSGAWQYNKLVVIVMPLLSYLWFKEGWLTFIKIRKNAFPNQKLIQRTDKLIENQKILQKFDHFFIKTKF